MEQQWTWEQLREKQDQRIRAALGVSAAESWPAIRELIAEADEMTPGTKTIWEGPGRGATLPISYQAVTDFIELYDEEAQQILADSVGSDDPVVAGHCLMGLSSCESPLLVVAVTRCRNRTESVFSIYGGFGWEGTLAEYADRLQKESER